MQKTIAQGVIDLVDKVPQDEKSSIAGFVIACVSIVMGILYALNMFLKYTSKKTQESETQEETAA